MLVLAIDTSGKNGGVALVRDGGSAPQVVANASIAVGSYSAQLIPQITSLLAQAAVEKRQIEAVVVASGPGSFTGLRVGIATAKGLAEVLGIVIVGITVLEAIAADVCRRRTCEGVIALLDAGRSEVYLGDYRVQDGRLVLLRELTLRQSELASALKAGAVTATSDPAVADVLRSAKFDVVTVERPDAAAIAQLGISKLLRGEPGDVATLDADYIRRSDAELFSLPKIERELKK
jgi:tRNA threonylcarbamoyladenosine biosynthesis protein TsaB